MTLLAGTASVQCADQFACVYVISMHGKPAWVHFVAEGVTTHAMM